MIVKTRADWGARPPDRVVQMSTSQGCFIHDVGVPVGAALYSGDPDTVAGWMRSTQRLHMDTDQVAPGGITDFAYSWAVDTRGVAWTGRGWAVTGGHTGGWNSKSHGICLILGPGQAPTPAMIATVNELIAENDRRFGQGFVKGHQEAPNSTQCPGVIILGLIHDGTITGAEPEEEDDDMAVLKQIAWTKPGSKWAGRVGLNPAGSAAIMLYESGIATHIEDPKSVDAMKGIGVPDLGPVDDIIFQTYTYHAEKVT